MLALLTIQECNSLPSLCRVSHLPRLQILIVHKCAALKSIIKAGDDDTKVIEGGNFFMSLKRLDLSDNPNLECIYEEELSFPSIVNISLRS